jgi:hypothetical protein
MEEEDEYGRTPWRYESTVTDPSGVRVTTTITVPIRVAWADVQECGELAQMGASQTAARVQKNAMASNEKVPF